MPARGKPSPPRPSEENKHTSACKHAENMKWRSVRLGKPAHDVLHRILASEQPGASKEHTLQLVCVLQLIFTFLAKTHNVQLIYYNLSPACSSRNILSKLSPSFSTQSRQCNTFSKRTMQPAFYLRSERCTIPLASFSLPSGTPCNLYL